MAEYPQLLLDGRMVVTSQHDPGSNAASTNFIYKFQGYEFFAGRPFVTALHTGADGSILAGSFEVLAAATANGARVKLGIR